MKKDQVINIDRTKCRVLIGELELQRKIKLLARRIKIDYASSDPPILLIVMNGGMNFGNDLSHYLGEFNFLHFVDSIKVKRYDANKATESVNMIGYPSMDLTGRNVIVVEDVLDEGITIEYLNKYLLSLKPKSLEYSILVLKDKYTPSFNIKYYILKNVAGMKWLIGYGMDDNGLFRWLRFICYKM